MLERIDNNIKVIDKIAILVSATIKIIRGFTIKLFLKKSNGFIFVGKNVSILNKHRISVGKNVKFEKNSEIQGLSSKGIIFGNNVTIGHTTMIRPSSYYGVGELGEGLIVGDNSSIGPFGYIGCAGFVKIGNNVMIGPRVSIFAENHNFSDIKSDIKSQGVNRKGIVIEDNCWIGSGVIILDGVKIGKGSVIAAGTLVTKDISAQSIVKDLRNSYTIHRK
ncbi:acyltransferase [Clostridium saccharobutylicum]|uniref:Acetyltransferase n=2 Tax=Clostridium saccharobutylicum TaxID=169679 RepID=U5MW12_CLOSA|nr:DapH/DapD/GlmU-related protein [Clostridium saccharobutylicum]AGX43826.1 acetyltransferase [Clostridium saccharobutylicum DSM 13864]AQR91126.1 putative acetyltransferase [Clostridium saccharobutylicum]AQS01030.1 putative acetyltransferase [Clostridium saccharobutylicum]AQS10769.1 putative acetyltransferase [Clostridium saccharobutylicum]AQS15013.1 putative acetyltransferase [Clostridium saccharobutylicum]